MNSGYPRGLNFLACILVGCALSTCSPAAVPVAAHIASAGAAAPRPSEQSTTADAMMWGTNHAHIHLRGHGYGSDASARGMDRLTTYGVNWIALTAFAFQPTSTSDALVGYGPGAVHGSRLHDPSMTDDDVKREISNAHARHIKVALKPHIWSGDFGIGKDWAGTIRQDTPQEHTSWWASYRAYILAQAVLARDGGADMLVLGTELVLMTKHEDEWRALIHDVRAFYAGPLTYAGHWQTEAFEIKFWDELDAIGVSAWFPLAAPDDASVEELTAAWAPHRKRLDALAARFLGKPIVFLELGFRSVKGAWRTPWEAAGGVVDEQAPARAFEATRRALQGASWWRGALLWKSFTDPGLAEESGDGVSYAFEGKPAGTVIRAWFQGQALPF